MRKINFTKEHLEKMKNLLIDMLINNEVILHKMITLDVVALLHTTSINSLNSCRLELGKAITNLENQDEWTTSEFNQIKLDKLKKQKELVNLIIGYKRWLEEQATIINEKKELEHELKALKESQKSPEDKIKELEAKLSDLKVETF